MSASFVVDATPVVERLNAIDTFTGVGGITLALAPFCQTSQYCEWDRYCQSVLIQRMSEGKLDRAPIHSDIRNLHVSSALKPEMIFGGFPCTDCSVVGLQKGIVDGQSSRMFFEMMRLVDENPTIEVLFFENVANIVNLGLKDVIDACAQRGFAMQWTTRTALSHGAPHIRARWFMLACRGNGAAKVASVVQKVLDADGRKEVLPEAGNVWIGNEPKVRVSFRPVSGRADPSYDDHWSSRCQTMGNAVVPSVVRQAFVDLALSSQKWSQYVDLLADSAIDASTAGYPFPDSAIVHEGKLYALPKRRIAPQQHAVEIVTPSGPNKDMVRIANFPTPRRGITHASALNDRSVKDLPTILVYCQATHDYLKEVGYEIPADKGAHQVLVPNVRYIEWMMGFPEDWTKIDRTSSTSIPMPLSRAAVARARLADAQGDEGDAEYPEHGRPEDYGDEEDAGYASASKQRQPVTKTKPPKKTGGFHLHGMHFFMRDHPGKDVSWVAKEWKALTPEERAVYSEKAKEHHRGGAAPPGPPSKGPSEPLVPLDASE